jgi:general secretion pathway protein G
MKKGFTLVEILVVLVIIGILVALILPNALKAIDSGNVKSTAATLRNIDTAIKLCYSEKQNWDECNTIGALEPGGTTVDGYMDTIPAGPGGSIAAPVDPWGVAYAIVAVPAGAAYGFESNKATHFTAWPDLTSAIR